MYGFVLWLVPTVEKFPRRQKFLLGDRLQAGTWRPGGYVSFEIRDPKRRTISAAPFRDRVIHHAVHAVVAPIFERGFIAHSYANRAGKGTHRAVVRYERLRDRHRWVLRGDIFRYFPAIDHEVLKADLRRRIRCRRTLNVLDLIVDGSNPQEPVHIYYPGDDLFTPDERRRGLPIGNLTSQFSPTSISTASTTSSPRSSARRMCATWTTSRCSPTIRPCSRRGAAVWRRFWRVGGCRCTRRRRTWRRHRRRRRSSGSSCGRAAVAGCRRRQEEQPSRCGGAGEAARLIGTCPNQLS